MDRGEGGKERTEGRDGRGMEDRDAKGDHLRERLLGEGRSVSEVEDWGTELGWSQGMRHRGAGRACRGLLGWESIA